MDYTTLSNLCDGMALDIGAAECHGLLCGLICTSPGAQGEDWLALLDDTEHSARSGPDTQERQQLLLLYEQTEAQLQADDFSLQLLLPEDDEPLHYRTRALVEWCQGFLYGAGNGRVSLENDLSDDVREIMADFSEISRASYDSDEDNDEDEAAYIELVEYIRGAVMLIFTELHTREPVHHGNPTLH